MIYVIGSASGLERSNCVTQRRLMSPCKVPRIVLERPGDSVVSLDQLPRVSFNNVIGNNVAVVFQDAVCGEVGE